MTWFDRMLLWLSAKGAGSWSQFRAAVEELHTQDNDDSADKSDGEEGNLYGAGNDLPVYQQVRLALQRLGHVEFHTDGGGIRWRVVPPTVAFFSDEHSSGVLCGARGETLIQGLNQIIDVEVSTSQIEGMPQQIMLCGDSQDTVVARAKALGLFVQRAAPIAILSGIPTVRESSVWHRSPMPETPGWLVQRFSTFQLQWMDVSQSDAAKSHAGLFRYVQKYQQFYYLRWQGYLYSVPVQVGKYAVMRKRSGILMYDAGRRVISIPAILRPPLLIERALILCSGRLPHFDTTSGRVEYTEVPRHVAQLAGQLLHQEIK